MYVESPPGHPAVTVAAPAKLTLSLRVVGVRPDGFHLIEAEMVSLDLADTLSFGPGDGLEVTETTTGLRVPVTDDNLVRRALAVVGRTAHVRLVKRIPAGGGLGGGSADAAAVLRWAGVADLVTAASVGADVPFCLRGGRARVTGIGEVLDPLPPVEATYTLVVPPFGCATPAVYRAWDAMGGPTGAGPNDLEPAALRVEPRLAEWRDRLGRATGETPVLAGSGSTWFVPGAHPGDGRIMVRATPPLLV
ncbi:4-(cytidine 5'-diphospho)-2-C-methyl-D-erythritol kinase [Iamia sp.]|uniref:4-(cytidine 5'-diphospho)-2-C-methyl-D-erythritol kinase n=1 Tax=Iamia sp. TaxID=2722710 RepID=UPI002C651613|nr:4-(cytidine 5'-diphospho)-2-C-methyl-D-erythritol kinase [Iamia sp.]HXH58733.1 4-(cytidine 5'-diphospho)-2-C-methyl-D-erythritol kinase [Iamia sp.]